LQLLVAKFLEIYNPLYVSIAGWGVAGVATIAIAGWFIMNMLVYNSFAVYLDGEFIGYIPYSEDLTSESFHEYAVLSLEAARGGVSANVTQTVTIEARRVSSSQRGSRGDILTALRMQMDYTIAATAIYVHGNFEALMRTQSCLDHLKDMLANRWPPPPGAIRTGWEFFYSGGNVALWEEVIVYVDPDPEVTEFTDATRAFSRLDRPRNTFYSYVVVSGDNLGLIATRFGTTLDRIMRYNNLTSHHIFPGQTLLIYTSRPLLSVRAYDEIQLEEPVEMPIETRYREDWSSHETNIYSYGSAGVQVTRELITSENGVERSRVALEPEIITPPTTHIIEVGTGAGRIEVRR
jgi:LysM repeat protein